MKINGIDVTPAPLTFNTLCEMEEKGAPIGTWSKWDMALMRAYVAVSAKVSAEEAGEMIGAHVLAGGSMDEVRRAFNRAAKESDFFAALRNRATAESEPA